MEIKPITLATLTPEGARGAAARELCGHFELLAQQINSACEIRSVAGGPGSPQQLLDTAAEFLRAFERLDAEFGDNGKLPVEDAANLGNYCLHCLAELGGWMPRLGLATLAGGLERLIIGAALWSIRHQCEIAAPEPVINALANLANDSTTRQDLAAIYGLMQGLAGAVPAALQADLERSDPQRPWRILLLNMAMVAIRTQDVPMMLHAFDLVGRHLPDEAPGFFAEAAQKARHPAFADEVRGLLQAEHARWTTSADRAIIKS